MVIFHSYVKLPEGKNYGKIHHFQWVNPLFPLGHGFNRAPGWPLAAYIPGMAIRESGDDPLGQASAGIFSENECLPSGKLI